MMNSIVKLGVAAAALAWAGAAGAAPLMAGSSLTLGSSGVSPDTGPLNVATSFNSPVGAFYSIGSGSFANLAGVPSNTTLLTFNPNPVPIPAGNGASSLSLSGSGDAAGFGTFQASSVRMITRTAGFLDLLFMGTYSPNFGGYDASENAVLRVDLNRTGDAVGFSGTLTVTGSTPSVPEPASMALLGTGLLGLGLARRRKAG